MDRDELIARLAEVLEHDDRVRAAWLSGSIGRGEADEYSDVDVWAVVNPADLEEVAASWPAVSETVSPLVLRQAFAARTRGVTFNHVTPEWLRFDLTLAEPDAVADRSADQLRLLFDRDGLAASLRPTAETRVPSGERVEQLAREFVRVLGLLPVVVGRKDYVVAAAGAGLLQGLLIQLMLEEAPTGGRGGALHLRKDLSPARYEALLALPPITATRDGVIASHVETARLFLPLARELSAATGVEWPDALEAAARDHVERQLGATI